MFRLMPPAAETTATTATPASCPPAPLQLADATPDHLPAIQAIYSHYVLHELCSFEEVPPGVDEMQARWTQVRAHGLPYLVALRGGRVAGYAYASVYRPRAAYRHTVEDSVYVDREQQGAGVGKALLGELIARCSGARSGGSSSELAQMVAVIGNSANAGSIGLHRSLGFEPVGVLRGVGFKLGQWVDTVLMQRAL
jgi:L-amino acid N-acyltransferase YncA